MTKLLFPRTLLLLTSLIIGLHMASGQSVKQAPDWHIFRGNQFTSQPIYFQGLDPATPVTAVAKYAREGALLPANMQPTVTRIGLEYRVNLANTALLPALSWIEVKAGGLTRLSANLYADKRSDAPLTTPITVPYGYDEPYLSLWSQLMTYLF